MTNLFGALDIDIWDCIKIWCLGFVISEVLNTKARGIQPITLFKTVILNFIALVASYAKIVPAGIG